MRKRAVEEAAFWDRAICLDCEAEAPRDIVECSECESSFVLPAETILRVAAFVEEEE